MSDMTQLADRFLAGQSITYKNADGLWRALKNEGELSLARAVLQKIRTEDGLIGNRPVDWSSDELCQQEAEITSKDQEIRADIRHDQALDILDRRFGLESKRLDGDSETLGIAGGILKRRWADLGQIEDLKRAGEMYSRGAMGALGEDAYAHINAAFIHDLLATLDGEDPEKRRAYARKIRERIVTDLPDTGSEWNLATRAEALFGLRRYAEATEVVRRQERVRPWKLETTARQLASLAHLHEDAPLQNAEIRAFFEALLPGAADAIRSAISGKVGLALSGGGFRASYYHLGVLARLAELDMLRHIEVLSCVSGGSIVGACYWLLLRRRMLDTTPMDRETYIVLVQELIEHFNEAVGTNIRAQVQHGIPRVVWRFLRGEKGALDPEKTAVALEQRFYGPLMPQRDAIYMHDLPFQPADHDAKLAGSEDFHPGRHNWLRSHKVPVLVLNATTVNTGHAWQFTPTWMGESPWAIDPAADSVPRLEWSWYAPRAGWQMRLGRAVAASACVPGVFAPLRIDDAFENVDVQLVDGGAYDNQGSVSLLALSCNVVIVSDASGQFLLERQPKEGATGLLVYAKRSMDALMARVRLANHTDLSARVRSGLLRGLMFLHMKAGLDADTIRLSFSQKSYAVRRQVLSPSGVRKDFQDALSALRTDLDDFTPLEANCLMACGYQMCKTAAEEDLADLDGFESEGEMADWPFSEMHDEITSTGADTPARKALLDELIAGSKVVL